MTSPLMRRFVSLLAAAAIGMASAAGFATEYFIGPNGSDGHSGTSAGSPVKTFGVATQKLHPGDTLTVLDGTYTRVKNEDFDIRCGRNAANGKPDARITVRAQHERKAWLKGDGKTYPFRMVECSYWDVEGLRASTADYRGGARAVFKVVKSDHIRTRRLLLSHANRYENSTVMDFALSHHCLAEDIEMYYFHRHGLSVFKSDTLTLRRIYANARGASDIDGGYGSHKCCTEGGDGGISLYYSSNIIVENSITTDTEAVSVISGYDTVLGNPAGRNIKILGSISMQDLRPSSFQSRVKQPGSKSAKNIDVQDYLVVGGEETAPMTMRGAQDMSLNNVTYYGATLESMLFLGAGEGDLTAGRYYFPACEYWPCDNQANNILFLNDSDPLVAAYAPDSDPTNLSWTIDHSNAWAASAPNRGFGADENVGDGSGHYRHSTQKAPTQMGLDDGRCLVYVPDGSNMKGAGKDGEDIGANILYRYKDGELTDKPLWDEQTGQFPCGARIPGSPNDVAGDSCYDIHQRLNVNQNGCQLVYGPTEPPRDVVLPSTRVTKPITLDGDLSEPSYARRLEFGDSTGASDNKAKVSSSWDDTWLYVGVGVSDADLSTGDGSTPWLDDGIEIFIDPNMDRSRHPLADDLKVLVVSNDTINVATAPDGKWKEIAHNVPIERALINTSDGYRLELAVGWDALDIAPRVGDKLGLLIANNDLDGDHTERFSFNDAEPFSTPSTWGTLDLIGSDNADGRRDAGVADTGPITSADAGRRADAGSRTTGGPNESTPHTTLTGKDCSTTGANPVSMLSVVFAALAVLTLARSRRSWAAGYCR